MAKGVALAFDLIARDGASPTFAKVAASADKAAASTARAEKGVLGFSKRAVAALGALATIDFAVHAVKDAAQFESAMNRIHTVVGASTEEVKTMSKAMLGLAGQVAQSPEHLAVSLYHMEAIGLRGAAALDAVKAAAMGAKIGNADLEETTNALTATIQSGVAGNQSFSKTMSQLLTIVGTGDMKLQDFNEALGSGLLAVMANAGVSLRDVGAALAVFGDNNIRGADAATMLRVAVQALQVPARSGAKALASIGLSTKDLKNDLLHGGLNSAISDLKKHLDASGQSGKRSGALLVEAFGKKANTGIGVLIHEFDLLEKKYGIIDANTNNFGEKWKATTKTAQFALDRLRAEFEVVAITVGQKLIPPVTRFVNFLTQRVGPNLVAPWHALDEVLSVVGTVFGAMGRVVGALHLPIAQIGIAVLGAVVAFKAMNGVVSILETLYLKSLYAKEAVVGLGVSARLAGAGVAEGGAAAAIGWRGMLGPLAAVGIGVGLLVSMFHKSDHASKEAANAAKAYTEALHDDSGKTTMVDAITKQLKDNKLPETLAKLNKELGSTRFNGGQFVTAIQNGGKSLTDLRGRLEAVVKAGTTVTFDKVGQRVALLSPAAKSAAHALGDLNAQIIGMSKAAKKDLVDTKSFAGVSSSIDQVSQVTQVGSDTAKRYAQMLGIVVDKNGIAAVSSKTLQAAVDTVTTAYNKASGAGDEYLKAFAAFGSSAGTAADRAALIGATLKAANGDALGFAGAMVNVYSANKALADGFQSDADKISGLRAQIKQIENPMKGQKVDTAALAAAQKDLADAYANSEKNAINLKTATIDYSKAGAAPLVGQLQAIQDAATKAASAQYQHEVATRGGKQAADDAYQTYKTQTLDALVSEARHLGLTNDQAKKFATTYFGLANAKDIKKTIEAAGTDAVVNVLTKIGKLLAKLTHTEWDIPVAVKMKPFGSSSQVDRQYTSFSAIENLYPHARGGYMNPGWNLLGEEGPELYNKSTGQILTAAKTRAKGDDGSKVGNTTINNIEKQELHVHYPEPGGLAEALPQLRRQQSLALGKFG